ncbi:PilZ domain-containing protein [Bacteriovorax sp. PP10]|uniref:PilZ domain-containing protein n=1 Tax=Bacteriovorax antarcticus TaxID=3088717 RepID=A0ABU5VVK7_9BACT|nr:PilZ domain-containing protein [Bacteriovorax sp. PP10]MEA9357099.1 PilZ domain-containing protein [Bacteriovorax sp. PP10]
MSDPRLQRKFLRAPLKSTALYVDGEHVFKARTLNLSEGGLLLSELPHIPEINSLPIAVNLIQYPRFQGMSLDDVKQLSTDDFARTIIKTKVRMVRSFENQSNVDKVFINFIGCEFYNPDPEFKLAVFSYVETFAKNTVYLLSLFESLGNRTEQLELLRSVAHLLGYDRRMKVPLLRAKVLHDYQSLGSL